MVPRTKDALAAALRDLLRKKPLPQITVKEIVTNCGVTRQCFYYHFDDIYSLFEWACLEEARKAIGEKRNYDTWEQGFYQMFILLQENKILVQNTLGAMERDYLERFIYNVLHGLVLAVVESRAAGLKVKRENMDFIARFYSHAFIAIGMDWVRNGMKENPKDIIEQIGVLVRGDIRKALESHAQT